MAEIRWTQEQKRIIEARNANILVSAAAGSGKTAVLVERILERILDTESPADVDRFVVVTFTRAAAAQMKQRLQKRLMEKLEKHPGDMHLQRQVGLVSSAHISTVHSFCGYVIQNYFHRIGLDPSYRQGTESELALLKSETIEKILEEEYANGAEDFVAFAGLSLFNRSDAAMADMVFQLYNQAMSEPFPEEWIARMEQMLSVQDEEEWEKSPLVRALLADTRRLLEGMKEEKEELLSVCGEPDGPYYFEKQLTELSELLDLLLSCQSYSSLQKELGSMKFSNMTGKKDDSVNEEKKQFVANGRNQCKEELKSLQKELYAVNVGGQLADLAGMAPPLLTLLRLTRKFLVAYGEAKRDRNIVDYNDLEQLALAILYEEDEKGVRRRSAAARELSDYFVEIMIDEYQDSNRVQDTILYAVSRDGRDGFFPNLFMVGDVKQSIYRFRNACPELFSEKLQTYSTEKVTYSTEKVPSSSEEGTRHLRIDLHQNFRSRELVLQGVNAVFDRVMKPDIGGVSYDADARLVAGKAFSGTEGRTADSIDLYVLVDNKEMEWEGRQAAACIREMMDKENPLTVLGENGYRPVEYRDIVILVRSVRTLGQPVFLALSEAGIPVVMEHTQGFFETREISLMTSMLQVLDNPRQDIPLAAVLASPMFGFEEEELASIRLQARDKDLYSSLLAVQGNEKAARFLKILSELREKIPYVTVAELIEDIYRETGIYEMVMMMPDGAQRTANMDFLMEHARKFDETAYHGLYQFVRYINRIREQKEQMGEVNIVGEGEDAVRIMTMHKSKGLEFPVCILMGLGRDLAKKGKGSPITVHPELGIASPIWNTGKHTKKDNMFCSALSRLKAREDLGEELRVLYVAMTRAGEKLILIGSTEEKNLVSGKMNYLRRSRMKCFLDMLMPAVLSEGSFFHPEFVSKENLLEEAVSDIVEERASVEALYNFDTGICYNEEIRRLLEKMDSVSSEDAQALPVKVSVSDLKRMSMEEPEEIVTTNIFGEPYSEEEMPVPSFMAEGNEEKITQGTAYGTIWHQVMAAIDFARTRTEEEIKEAIEELVEQGKIRSEETSVLHYGRLRRFFSSELGEQMRKAAALGKLYREQPFVIRCPASRVFPGRTETTSVLVQGIIDAYYENKNGIVLVDYKTDAIREGEEGKLAERYATQMAFYKEALETMMDRAVEACVLYSFSLGRAVCLPEMGETNV